MRNASFVKPKRESNYVFIIKTIETHDKLFPMTKQKRILWLIILFIVQNLYFPINQYMQGGVIISTPLDAYIPLWSVWAIPYLLSIFWWIGSFLWATWKMDSKLYLAFVLATTSVMLSSYIFYILYPTYINRPILEENSWTMDLVRYIYSQDRSYNAFPSGHTYTSVLIALFWTRWYPKRRILWIIITAIILFSTLFTGQHHIPDLIAGTLLAWAGYRYGLWCAARSTL